MQTHLLHSQLRVYCVLCPVTHSQQMLCRCIWYIAAECIPCSVSCYAFPADAALDTWGSGSNRCTAVDCSWVEASLHALQQQAEEARRANEADHPVCIMGGLQPVQTEEEDGSMSHYRCDWHHIFVPLLSSSLLLQHFLLLMVFAVHTSAYMHRLLFALCAKHCMDLCTAQPHLLSDCRHICMHHE